MHTELTKILHDSCNNERAPATYEECAWHLAEVNLADFQEWFRLDEVYTCHIVWQRAFSIVQSTRPFVGEATS